MCFGRKKVAPFAGAWIEMKMKYIYVVVVLSHPSRVRGLKFMDSCITFRKWLVAPFAGAWIEITIKLYHFSAPAVAPFAGAWIEICKIGFKRFRI